MDIATVIKLIKVKDVEGFNKLIESDSSLVKISKKIDNLKDQLETLEGVDYDHKLDEIVDYVSEYIEQKKYLVREKIDIDYMLIRAVRDGDIKLCEFLVGISADINFKHFDVSDAGAIYYYEYSALTEAIERGNYEICEFLIKIGANINEIYKNNYYDDDDYNDDNYGRMRNEFYTPLIYAIMKKDKEISELLITSGANLTIRNHENKTPFMYAIQNKNLEISNILIKYGAYKTMTEKDYKTILSNGWKDLIKQIILQSRKDAFERRKHFLKIREPYNY
jgi:hypothetical protein